MPTRYGKLLLSHIHADDTTLRSYQFLQPIAIPAAAQVQHLRAFQRGWNRQTTAVQAILHLIVQLFQDRYQMRRNAICGAAGAGLQICRRLQHLAIILAQDVVIPCAVLERAPTG